MLYDERIPLFDSRQDEYHFWKGIAVHNPHQAICLSSLRFYCPVSVCFQGSCCWRPMMCSACIMLCAQFPAELQAEGARQLPQRQAGTSRQSVGGSPRQIYPRHDGETTDTESTLEREVSIVSKHFRCHKRMYWTPRSGVLLSL